MQHNGLQVTLAELLALRAVASRSSGDNRRAVQSTNPGEVRSPSRGRGVEFMEVRPYQSGDDIRSIDWRVSARTGKPFTRLYAEERERPVFLAVDQRVNMYFGSGAVFKSVLAARLTALIGWCALAAGDRVGGLVAGESIHRLRSSSTRRSLVRFLQTVSDANRLLDAQTQSPPTLDQVLRDCLLNTSTGTTVSVISDFHDASTQTLQSLMALGRKRKLILLKVNDPMETAFPPLGGVGIGNGLDTARVFISRRHQKQFKRQHELFTQQLIDCAAQCSAALIPVSTSDQLTDVFNRYARKN